MNHRRRSAIDAPGMVGTPPVITRVGMPSVCESTAKIVRDDLMTRLHEEHPVYRWERNKGYASAEHRDAIRSHGLSAHHRTSWVIADAPTLF